MRHDHRLAHVDFEVVKGGHRDVLKAERHHFIIAGTPIADDGGIVAVFTEDLGHGQHLLGRGIHGFAVRIHLPDPVGLRVLGGHQRNARLHGRGNRRIAALKSDRARRQHVNLRRNPGGRRARATRRSVTGAAEFVAAQGIRGKDQNVRPVAFSHRAGGSTRLAQHHPAAHARHH